MGNKVRNIIADMQEERRTARQVRNIVSCLMVVLNIPEGNHLVMLFGCGDEKDNREALATWVNQMLPEINVDETEYRMEKLYRRAKLRIENIWR